MDLQCPAMITCMAPSDDLPTSAGGHRVVAGYLFGLTGEDTSEEFRRSGVPLHPAPAGKFWQVLPSIADAHRGEGVVLIAPAETLDQMDLRGVTLSVDSDGPQRI